MSTAEQDFKAWEMEDGKIVAYLDGGTYLIDDRRVVIKQEYPTRAYTLDANSKIQRVHEKTRIKHYVSTKDGTILPTVDFQAQSNTLYAAYDDDNDRWASLEAEFAYRAFRDSYSPVMETYEEYTDVAIGVLPRAIDVNRFIYPNWKLNGNLKDTTFTYNRQTHAIAIVREMLNAVGYRELETRPYSYSDCKAGEYCFKRDNRPNSDATVEYAYLDGSYMPSLITTLKEYEKTAFYPLSKSEAIARYNTTETDVRAAVALYLGGEKPVAQVVPEVALRDLTTKLQHAAKCLDAVEPFKKSHQEYNTARNTMKDALKMLHAVLPTAPNLLPKE